VFVRDAVRCMRNLLPPKADLDWYHTTLIPASPAGERREVRLRYEAYENNRKA